MHSTCFVSFECTVLWTAKTSCVRHKVKWPSVPMRTNYAYAFMIHTLVWECFLRGFDRLNFITLLGYCPSLNAIETFSIVIPDVIVHTHLPNHQRAFFHANSQSTYTPTPTCPAWSYICFNIVWTFSALPTIRATRNTKLFLLVVFKEIFIKV